MAKPKIIKELEEKENGQEWILTSERLPKNEERVLYVTKDGMVYSGVYYDADSLSFEWGEFGNFDNDNDVVGWKPYPKLHNQESENK